MTTVNQGLDLIIIVTVLVAYIAYEWSVIVDEFDYSFIHIFWTSFNFRHQILENWISAP